LCLCRALHVSPLEFKFTICGNGAAAGEVEEWVANENDARFSFGPILPEAKFARALMSTDYYVITEGPGFGGSFIPSKLIPGLMSGTPILTVCDAGSPLGQEVGAVEPGLHLPWEAVTQVGARLATVPTMTYAKWAGNTTHG